MSQKIAIKSDNIEELEEVIKVFGGIDDIKRSKLYKVRKKYINSNTCIDKAGLWGTSWDYCNEDWYREKGFKIISAKEFLKSKRRPAPKFNKRVIWY